jgi:hypothetical protein
MDVMSDPTSSPFAVIPRGAKIASVLIVTTALLGVMTWIFGVGISDGRANRSGNGIPEWIGVALVGVVACTVFAALVLALGYVYGDAKRRGMHPVLWTLIVAITPNLIGFLLYFALRRPLLAPCRICGAGIGPDQRFCSSCGCEQQAASGTSSSAGAPPAPASPVPTQPRSGLSLKSFAVGFSVWTGIFLSKSLFAYLKHDHLDSAVLFGFAAIGVALLIAAHQNPAATR